MEKTNTRLKRAQKLIEKNLEIKVVSNDSILCMVVTLMHCKEWDQFIFCNASVVGGGVH
jgi:hypothetical protein